MEWVETTAKTVEAAKDLALDRLGVAADEADFEVLEEPRGGLFGRVRGEARVRARIRPTAVRPKQDRRRDRKSAKVDKADKGSGDSVPGGSSPDAPENSNHDIAQGGGGAVDKPTQSPTGRNGQRTGQRATKDANGSRPKPTKTTSAKTTGAKDDTALEDGARESNASENNTGEHDMEDTAATPAQVGEAAVVFMSGLADAFGATSTTTLAIDGDELEVKVTGADLGVLVGPGGRTLNAIQDLVRVAAQRRLGDHETRLRIDVAGYREKRKGALEQFARTVAAQVVESGQARALEPMSSADRKVVHDAIGQIDGVESRSDGEDPSRRVVIAPS